MFIHFDVKHGLSSSELVFVPPEAEFEMFASQLTTFMLTWLENNILSGGEITASRSVRRVGTLK